MLNRLVLGAAPTAESTVRDRPHGAAPTSASVDAWDCPDWRRGGAMRRPLRKSTRNRRFQTHRESELKDAARRQGKGVQK